MALRSSVSARLLFLALTLTASVTATTTAGATPTFPPAVQAFYGWPSILVDPPTGCRLCHTSELGGIGTSNLSAFGLVLVSQYQVIPYDVTSLNAALTALPALYPLVAHDLQQGVDPNDDVYVPQTGGAGGAAGAGGASDGGGAAFANPPPLPPHPTYGCAIAAGMPDEPDGAWLGAGLVALGLARHRALARAGSRAANAKGRGQGRLRPSA